MQKRWEFIKENKRVRKQELDQESDQENKKKRKHAFDKESDQEKKKNKENALSTKKATKNKRINFLLFLIESVFSFFFLAFLFSFL